MSITKAYNPVVKLHSHEQGGHEEVNATEFSLWDEHPVEQVGHRWGMSIDLSSVMVVVFASPLAL